MGKRKKNAPDLGRALIRDRFGGTSHGKRNAGDSSLLHTAELSDGYDWGRLNLQSVTEESSYQDFLSTAELAGTEFQAEKLNITFVKPQSRIGLLSKEKRKEVKETQDKNRHFLQIPRRPPWDGTTTAEDLQMREREEFLNWRRRLAELQEIEGVILTPYEKNIEFWRQLWRVVERSDVVVQIVDARNPLLFRCEDLEKYVKEVGEHKLNLILINKSDFLTEEQRSIWADYFNSRSVQVAFFSAIQEISTNDGDSSSDASDVKETSSDESDDLAEGDGVRDVDDADCLAVSKDTTPEKSDFERKERTHLVMECKLETLEQSLEETEREFSKVALGQSEPQSSGSVIASKHSSVCNTSKLLNREELITLFKTIHTGNKVHKGVTTIGLVGYPNVGKSSTINTLLTYKKVSVSATPGKTKHFQTLFLDTDLQLCDCPGLVMPTFVFTKAEMVVSGILPIDQMRDHVPPVTLVASLIPRHVLEEKYGIMLPLPEEGEDPDRPPTSEELLNAYGYNRGFMTQRGLPDNPRSARYILKDFVNGKLLYSYAPPGNRQEDFHKYPSRKKLGETASKIPPQTRATKPAKITGAELDRTFFTKVNTGAHTKGTRAVTGYQPVNSSEGESSVGSSQSLNSKPWKKHHNKNKKEKLRRVYAHLDQ